ncbi:succinylglutamate desuccinylase/aspartoacylase family protein [Halobacteriovorax sp. HLS]|uniref:succinylglutamate desuccinylase/aspartoacylase domain-containing protein n=1 Tax=Halobacteriovorax sp. HLS TaxID=2234000 RepID=UPI000FDA7BAC|nr:succinylglutamate desuccinylase/aspartoacylase family protein [Halobacteriovorax sp. HLS]
MNKVSKTLIPIHELPSGDTLKLSVIDIKGPQKGPKCYIQASVHGAEHQGNAVIFQMLKYLESQEIKGSIRIVPMANPAAINSKMGTYTHGRFNPNTGDNWNRLYCDYTKDKKAEITQFAQNSFDSDNLEIAKEYKKLLSRLLIEKKNEILSYGPKHNGILNLELQNLSLNADYVLDLHTGPIATRYLYVPQYLEQRCDDLNFPHNLIIPNEFAGAMDEACFTPWINLKQAFKDLDFEYHIPFESYTVELGSEERISLEEAQLDLRHILHYLYKRGVVTSDVETPNNSVKKCLLSDYKTYYAPVGGLYEFNFRPGQVVKKGQNLATIVQLNNYLSDKEVISYVVAKRDCIVINHYASSSVASGSELIQVMENIY